MKRTIRYAATGLLSLWMVVLGGAKLWGTPALVEQMATLHYSEAFTRFLGLCELLGGIGLWIRRTQAWAVVGLMIIFVGAIGSHVAAGQGWGSAGGAIIAFTLATLSIALSRGTDLRALFIEDRRRSDVIWGQPTVSTK